MTESIIVRALGPQLDHIHDALPKLHDDAFSPIRSIAPVNIELNEFTRPYYDDSCPTSPSLRRGTGAQPLHPPTPDRHVRPIWDKTETVIVTAYRLLAGPIDRHPPVHQLQTACHRIHAAWLLRPDAHPALKTEVRHVAEITRGWWAPASPAKHGTTICKNPDRRWQCKGLAAETGQAAEHQLCGSCNKSRRNKIDYRRKAA